jgi:hypothetical protein
MMDHVSARCAHFRLLFPSRNIESIVTLGEGVRIVPAGRRTAPGRKTEPPVLDMNRLLGATQSANSLPDRPQADSTAQRTRIQLDWVSTDYERRAALIVDAVDEIVASHMQHLERVPFLPARLLPFCDGVLRDADSTCRLSIRLDVTWPMDRFADRRLWRQAMVRVETVQTEATAVTAAAALQPAQTPGPGPV